MRRNVESQTKAFARANRNNPTKAETILWTELRLLREHGFKIRCQHCIESYILDFACISLQLAIKIDGLSHAESENYGRNTTIQLQALGWTLLRFNNLEVLTNPHLVATNIFETCENMSHKWPSP